MKKCAFVYLPFILLMFFFNSCILYKEKLWLNKDGSGKMVMKIGIERICIPCATIMIGLRWMKYQMHLIP